MRFGIIVCSKCKKAKGVSLDNKTTKCFYCGRAINLSKVKILYKTESREELQNKLGKLNAELFSKKE